MKKILLFASFCAIICVLQSCGPHVVTDMFTSGYAPQPVSSVRVINYGDSIPAGSLAIGKVKVVDGGLSVKCNYDKVVQKGIEATAKNGGKMLMIDEHLTPDLISTCHRIWGTMLWYEDEMMDSLVPVTAKYQVERNQIRYSEKAEKRRRLQESQKSNVLKVSAGPSWLTTRFVVDNRTYNSRMGYSFFFDYEHIWKSGLGVGVSYFHNHTSFDDGVSFSLDYFGPSMVASYMLSERWRWMVQLGFGPGWYTEHYSNISDKTINFALLCQMDIEYKLSEKVGLGLGYNVISMRMEKPDGFELKENEFYGIRELMLRAGLRVYF